MSMGDELSVCLIERFQEIMERIQLTDDEGNLLSFVEVARKVNKRAKEDHLCDCLQVARSTTTSLPIFQEEYLRVLRSRGIDLSETDNWLVSTPFKGTRLSFRF